MARVSRLHELLLVAALGEGEAATRAWSTLRPDLDLDHAEHGSLCLLPLVYRALSEAGVDDPLLEQLKGTYRSAWTRNQLALSDLRAALRALDGVDVTPLLLGGAPLAIAYYPEVALRPLPHVELGIGPDKLAVAAGALQRTGWTLSAPARWARPAVLRSPRSTVCLVHAAARHELRRIVTVPAAMGGVRAEALDPADELFLACVRASRAAATRSQSLVDVHMLVTSAGTRLDWDRLLQQAEAQRLTIPVRDTLVYLSTTLATPVPAEVLERLASIRPLRRERLARRLTPTFGEFVRSTATEPLPRALLGLPRFLERAWELDSSRQVPLATLRRAGRRLHH